MIMMSLKSAATLPFALAFAQIHNIIECVPVLEEVQLASMSAN